MNKNMKKRTMKRAAAMLAAVYFACAALTGCGKVEITKPMAYTSPAEDVTFLVRQEIFYCVINLSLRGRRNNLRA